MRHGIIILCCKMNIFWIPCVMHILFTFKTFLILYRSKYTANCYQGNLESHFKWWRMLIKFQCYLFIAYGSVTCGIGFRIYFNSIFCIMPLQTEMYVFELHYVCCILMYNMLQNFPNQWTVNYLGSCCIWYSTHCRIVCSVSQNTLFEISLWFISIFKLE